MRRTIQSIIQVLLAFVLLAGYSSAQAVQSDGKRVRQTTTEEGVGSTGPKGTTFNDKDVPPILTLEGPTWKETVSIGYWLVEAYSPYCHHCQSLAPKWQTLYEYYYTMMPLDDSTDAEEIDVSFSKYYKMTFAKLDCVAYGSACVDAGAGSFPTIILFKNGQEIKRSEGDRNMDKLSTFIEECLELIRPGSRPQEGIQLPEVGAKEFWPKGKLAVVSNSHQILATKAQEIEKRPEKPTSIPNPNGVSIPLDTDAFQAQVARTLTPWFVKLYAPWCPHCQRMGPSWNQMARELKGELNIGEVNCETEKRLCKELEVTSYPTIVYFRGPERVEYEGGRGLGDLIQYGQEAVESEKGVPRVNADEFDQLEEKEEVIFVYFYDHATTSEDMLALERLPLSLIGRAKIVKTDDRELGRRFRIFSWPRLLVVRGGRAIHYDWLMPQDMRSVSKIRHWMQSVWHPLVPELTAANARDIMDGKYVVLGILNRDREEDFLVAKREIKNAAVEWMERQDHQFTVERQELRDAKQLRIEEAEDRNDQRALRNAKLIRINMDEIERKEVTFAWIDGIFWQRWIKTTFGLTVEKDGEKVIINDHNNRRYWDQTSTGNPIVPSRTSILETLTQITSPVPKLTAKATGSSVARAYFKARHLLRTHPVIFSIGSVVLLLLLTVLYCRNRRRLRRRSFGTGGFLRLESEKEKGVVNGKPTSRPIPGPNGKAD